MSNIVNNTTKDAHVARSHFSNLHRAFQYADNNDSLSATDLHTRKKQFLAGPSTTAKRRGKILGNLEEYPDSITWNLARDPRADDDMQMREDKGFLGEFTKMIDPIVLLKQVKHYLIPSTSVEGKFGGFDNTGVVYAYDLPYVGSGMVMGQRKTPLSYHHDIIAQRPGHMTYEKTSVGLKRYADSLLRDLPYYTEDHKRATYEYIDRLVSNKKLVRQSTNIEMKSHVHKFIQTFQRDTRAIKRILYRNTI